MTATVRLTEALIARQSVTPEDHVCQDLMAERLRAIGFECQTLVYGPQAAPVTNLWAIKRGRGHAAGAPTLVFAGHTDVVPTGPLDQWTSPPFVPSYRDGLLYGRGAARILSRSQACVVGLGGVGSWAVESLGLTRDGTQLALACVAAGGARQSGAECRCGVHDCPPGVVGEHAWRSMSGPPFSLQASFTTV